MRFKVELSYDGTNFSGWQRQDNALSVQEVVEDKLSIKLREKIDVVGCGRTDAGVHASTYVLHFDVDMEIDGEDIIPALNKMLPESIGIRSLEKVHDSFHARFDAYHRAYVYHIHSFKDPFKVQHSYHFPPILNADFDKMDQVAALILEYDHFAPFCKSHSDVKTMRCMITESKWTLDHERGLFSYYIGADRFLRGMVRLIVGSCIQVGMGKSTLEEIKAALDKQHRLPKPLTVPSQGLFLCKVKY